MKKFVWLLPFLLCACDAAASTSSVLSASSSEQTSDAASTSSLQEVSSETSLNDEEILQFIGRMDEMEGTVVQTERREVTDGQIRTVSEYTSTLFQNNIIIDSGTSTYGTMTFSFQIQTYETQESVVRIWYYGENDSSNYAKVSPKSSYTAAELASVFYLGKCAYFQSWLRYIVADEPYETTEDGQIISHVFNRDISVLKTGGGYVLNCDYEYQTTCIESDGSSVSEVMNYSIELTFSDTVLLSSYEKIVGAQFLDEYQYTYSLKESEITYTQGEPEEFTGLLLDPEHL